MSYNVTTTGSITASLTASTIAFTAPDTITDSGSGFGIFSPGDYITISGSGPAVNNSNRQILTAAAGIITVAAIPQNGLVTEAAGASITISAGVGINTLKAGAYPYEPLVFVHPSVTNIIDFTYADLLSKDTKLGVAIDAGEVSLTIFGTKIINSTALASIGSGSAIDFNYSQTIFVGQHGDDSNDGLSKQKAFLTLPPAITAGAALLPSAINRIKVQILDGATYEIGGGAYTHPDFVDVYGKDATITTDVTGVKWFLGEVIFDVRKFDMLNGATQMALATKGDNKVQRINCKEIVNATAFFSLSGSDTGNVAIINFDTYQGSDTVSSGSGTSQTAFINGKKSVVAGNSAADAEVIDFTGATNRAFVNIDEIIVTNAGAGRAVGISSVAQIWVNAKTIDATDRAVESISGGVATINVNEVIAGDIHAEGSGAVIKGWVGVNAGSEVELTGGIVEIGTSSTASQLVNEILELRQSTVQNYSGSVETVTIDTVVVNSNVAIFSPNDPSTGRHKILVAGTYLVQTWVASDKNSGIAGFVSETRYKKNNVVVSNTNAYANAYSVALDECVCVGAQVFEFNANDDVLVEVSRFASSGGVAGTLDTIPSATKMIITKIK